MLTSSSISLFTRSSRRGHGFLHITIVVLLTLTILLYLKTLGQTESERNDNFLIVPGIPGIRDLPSMPSWHDIGDNVQSVIQHKLPVQAHPIDGLIAAADKDFSAVLLKETNSVKTAAARYRVRRDRHPPPGFDRWVQFAMNSNATIIEDFFDQIYHDLGPFWGLPAGAIRREAWDYEMTISVRNGNASTTSDWFWTKIWLEMIETIVHMLPDMDIPLNAMDEPRLVVPSEEISEYMRIERTTRKISAVNKTVNKYHSLPKPGQVGSTLKTRDKKWETPKSYWEIAIRGCDPSSLARHAEVVKDFDHRPRLSSRDGQAHMTKGYVSNFSLSTDFCHQPDLQALHGMFIEPLTVSASSVLFPMFGGSKLSTNNEILLPAPMYWSDEERFSGGSSRGVPWPQKENRVIWRGVATGGKNRADNWKGFQRHRFVAMTNGTQAYDAEAWKTLPENWALPESEYQIESLKQGRFGSWIDRWADAAFVDLNCEPPEADGQCSYTSPYFSTKKAKPMATQFNYKYLPDIDGNSFSGRYRGFLLSTSLPIKATLFREWHDARLVAWKHFVPMDNRFGDFYGIMQYFLGYEGDENGEGKVEGHDAAAAKIAREGREWAAKVLRKEDMQVYVLRLLLEYARVSSDDREVMGWVGDLVG